MYICGDDINAPSWVFMSQDILYEYSIGQVTFGTLMPYLHSLLGYFTGEFQAVQMIVHAVFGAVDVTIVCCMLVYCLEL